MPQQERPDDYRRDSSSADTFGADLRYLKLDRKKCFETASACSVPRKSIC
jgi:hypothetical protein